MDLTQDEVEQLFELKKYQVKDITFDFPFSGEAIEIELQNSTGRVKFIADIDNSNQFVKKAKLQLRYKKIFVLRRIDFNGNHKNPPSPSPNEIFNGWENYNFKREDHIHFYIEGYGERWALPLTAMPELGITNNDDLCEKVIKFFKYCNVQDLKIRKLLEL
jgi:hypothetical protein